jgi:chaperonin GroEL (HSP60 family)
VPGGGAALLHLSELVPAFKDSLTDAEEKLGAEIVMKALRAPARIIAENAGARGGGGGAQVPDDRHSNCFKCAAGTCTRQ